MILVFGQVSSGYLATGKEMGLAQCPRRRGKALRQVFNDSPQSEGGCALFLRSVRGFVHICQGFLDLGLHIFHREVKYVVAIISQVRCVHDDIAQ